MEINQNNIPDSKSFESSRISNSAATEVLAVGCYQNFDGSWIFPYCLCNSPKSTSIIWKVI